MGCRVEIDRSQWQPPTVFGWLQELGNIEREEMFRVFNMGIGFVLVARQRSVEAIEERLAKHSLVSHRIGSVAAGERGVTLAN